MTKLDRVLSRHRVTTISLVQATKAADPSGKGYSRTYIYGLRRGDAETDNPTRECMAVVLTAVRSLTGDKRLQISDLFDLEPATQQRRAAR